MNDSELAKYWARKYGPRLGIESAIRGAIDWVRSDEKSLRASIAALKTENEALKKKHEAEINSVHVQREWEQRGRHGLQDNSDCLADMVDEIQAKLSAQSIALADAVKALEGEWTKDEMNGCNDCGGIGLHLHDCRLTDFLRRLRRCQKGVEGA